MSTVGRIEQLTETRNGPVPRNLCADCRYFKTRPLLTSDIEWGYCDNRSSPIWTRSVTRTFGCIMHEGKEME